MMLDTKNKNNIIGYRENERVTKKSTFFSKVL